MICVPSLTSKGFWASLKRAAQSLKLFVLRALWNYGVREKMGACETGVWQPNHMTYG
jgi:hypothetical protein